jgi:chorismate-pyruvate lyase
MNEFYEDAGLALPEVVPVEGQDVPEPYRSLLVHDRDMTPTLASAYRRAMQLRVFKRVVRENILARQIILEIEGNGKPVVFAAIKIHLDRFPSEARRLILEGKQAFGNILHGQQIVHFSQPEAFFRVVTDDTINQALGLTGHSVLYGRRTAMWHSSDIALAQVLEILPPSA